MGSLSFAPVTRERLSRALIEVARTAPVHWPEIRRFPTRSDLGGGPMLSAAINAITALCANTRREREDAEPKRGREVCVVAIHRSWSRCGAEDATGLK